MYVIIRRLLQGDIRRNSPSIVHEFLAEAKAEAHRLAEQNINSYFDVFKLTKVGSAIGNVSSIWQEEIETRKRK